MGDHATTNDPSNATFEQKGKGKDVQDQIAEDSSDEESDQEPEMVSSDPILSNRKSLQMQSILLTCQPSRPVRDNPSTPSTSALFQAHLPLSLPLPSSIPFFKNPEPSTSGAYSNSSTDS